MNRPLLLAATDPNSIYLLRRYAEESGFSLVHAREGKEILPLARRARPAAILVETGLPGLSGRDLLRDLRAEDATRGIPVVVCCYSEDEADWQAQDVAGCLQHPILLDHFLAVLQRAGIASPGLVSAGRRRRRSDR